MLKEINKIKWVKGSDFMDNTPRYTFEGRDPQDSLADIQVVIYTQREREFTHDSKTRNYYYGYVRHNPSETSDEIGRFRLLKDAKMETEQLFREYCEKFPNDVGA